MYQINVVGFPLESVYLLVAYVPAMDLLHNASHDGVGSCEGGVCAEPPRRDIESFSVGGSGPTWLGITAVIPRHVRPLPLCMHKVTTYGRGGGYLYSFYVRDWRWGMNTAANNLDRSGTHIYESMGCEKTWRQWIL